jgi:hypothetical protein
LVVFFAPKGNLLGREVSDQIVGEASVASQCRGRHAAAGAFHPTVAPTLVPIRKIVNHTAVATDETTARHL